jgi:hypothetical protein
VDLAVEELALSLVPKYLSGCCMAAVRDRRTGLPKGAGDDEAQYGEGRGPAMG